MLMRSALLLLAFIAATSALNLKIRTSAPGAEVEALSSRIHILAGQSFEAECWPESFEFPEDLTNYSIQFLKYSAPFQPKPHWSENPLLGRDSRLISGNELLVDEVVQAASDRYDIIQKEHTYEDGTRVPKFVLSIRNAQPEDTGKLECYLMEEVIHPHHDPTDIMKQAADNWGKPVIIIADVTSMEMLKYEFNDQYNYDIMAKETLGNGQYIELDEGEVPAIACRLFFPSYYPTVRFLLKNDQGHLVSDVTDQFIRYYEFKKQTTQDQGPLIRMEFMQDYINDVSDGAVHFKFNSSHDGLNLWCEAQVVSPTGESFRPHAQYVTLKLKRSEEAGYENTEHLPKYYESKRPVGSVDKIQHDGASEVGGVSYEESSSSKKEAQEASTENSASVLLASLAVLPLALMLRSL